VETGIENGCIFLMDRLLLPAGLRFQGRRYSAGWRLLNSLKSNDIELRARDCGWNFVYLAAGMKRTGLGLGQASSLRKAITKLLTEARQNAFNSVEVTEVTARQLLGLHWVSVAAHPRSLQQSHQIKALPARRRELAKGSAFLAPSVHESTKTRSANDSG